VSGVQSCDGSAIRRQFEVTSGKTSIRMLSLRSDSYRSATPGLQNVPMTITYSWRGEFEKGEVNALHAEGFDHRLVDDDIHATAPAQPWLGNRSPR
jgi:hypothetical protein